MTGSLFDRHGVRKYLVPAERHAFVSAAARLEHNLASFCLTLAITGARISEVLALMPVHIDRGDETVVFRTLKQRSNSVFRAVPVPSFLLDALEPLKATTPVDGYLWPYRRTTAWKLVKIVMEDVGIANGLCMPKALRHAFAVEAVLNGVPLNIVQRWMGHARLETTAIYASVLGEEERSLAGRTWKSLEYAVSRSPNRS